MRRLQKHPLRDVSRRATSLVALGLFLAGTNFCVFAPPPSLSAPASTGATASHGCCGAAREKAARNADATREATAPCCVAVAPVLAAHGATVAPAPELAAPFTVSLVELEPATPVLAPIALAEDARPPALHSATPDAGRAPPRL